MKIIKPSVEFYGPVPTDYENALKFIEKAGRTCYKSEDKITDDSAEKFVRKLIKAGHLAMVEHSNFVVRIDNPTIKVGHLTGKFINIFRDEVYTYVGGNLTAWFQQAHNSLHYGSVFRPFFTIYGNLFDIKEESFGICNWQVCPHDEIPPELHRYAAKFICDRGVSHEFVRHRVFSFTQESTRYCNYSKDKFDSELTFIHPVWCNTIKESTKEERVKVYGDKEVNGWYASDNADNQWVINMLDAEITYISLIDAGWKPQQARSILPNSLKTELIMTGFDSDWEHFFLLRDADSAHPQARELAKPLHEQFIQTKMYNSLTKEIVDDALLEITSDK